MNKTLKGILVLSLICLISAMLLGGVNLITKDKIADNEKKETEKALYLVLPEAKAFSDAVDLASFGNMPDSVKELYVANDGSVAVKSVVRGHENGLTIITGINKDGKITKSVCIASGETYGVEYSYGENFVGKDSNSASGVETVGGMTETTGAYKGAVSDALAAFSIVSPEIDGLKPNVKEAAL